MPQDGHDALGNGRPYSLIAGVHAARCHGVQGDLRGGHAFALAQGGQDDARHLPLCGTLSGRYGLRAQVPEVYVGIEDADGVVEAVQVDERLAELVLRWLYLTSQFGAFAE